MSETKQMPAWQSALFIGLKLLLICAVVAGIVSFIYALTTPIYEENLKATKNRAIGEIFGLDAPVCTVLGTSDGATVYTVKNDGVCVGYCAEVSSAGFGGNMSLMVGYSVNKEILGVTVISNSETPGVGSKAVNPSYLAQYEGKSGNLSLGSDVDAVSGATISSKAVLAGVNLANSALDSLIPEVNK